MVSAVEGANEVGGRSGRSSVEVGYDGGFYYYCYELIAIAMI